MTQQRPVKVAIIGAGMSGMCMAIKLQEAGIDSFTIFEKADDVGGTWRDNTYPGLTCDVPSRYYSYSFRPNPNWSRWLPPGAEIQAYFRQVADERAIRPHIRFGTDVTSARYDDGQWRVTTATGVEAFDVLVTATGFLRVPRYPDIPGRDTFAGPSFHSSRWDHCVSLPDKRIGLIGTGSTGAQITSELGGKVRGLKVFQRTAQWIAPVPNPRYSALTKATLRRWPKLNELPYRFWGWYVSGFFGRAPIRPGFARDLATHLCRWNLRLSVPDPQLRAKLTPTYQPMCKRLVISGRFYRSVQQPGVEVIIDPIDHIEPRGVVTAEGTLHELDLLVYATGFDARAYVRPMEVIGAGGLTLDEAWADGPMAYRSVAVPGFPNMFMLMGPHSPIGNQSLVPVAEDQADYAMWWIEQLRAGRLSAAAPTEAATKHYNEDMKAAMPQTVWVTGCSSWYLGKDGLPELFPWTPETHRELLRQPRLADFDVRTA
ncbi:pyridine nucleotide-disulfide oxidoreductase family protein [Mycobacterium kansasii 732]|uniref:Putative monooxygenase n=1 Tax=Mycobacterium pseudokansasii TaxID=2341080 RepID=A0A498QSC3_9MYCO|nr:NAD(P)/FAD-dependent oxidoreductase [Mycobacterium pseudokansasii]EUA06562.1 pyridine nucleotide-disulfide oxidoreductase family protein [Mycobacterium kansasii 732]KZS69465.1 monooxygenase [Mycobacterium kansasii]MBY0387370.1 NAD(P)/FAD-dependent oxidoreductase [Mycobacterium pseudokansasii]VAZ96257.1 putative monooxygenase [Mycobacterium pseudokansasii]VAZ97561.1 putative monooxygenase [Mycobacterium pseudokansasii]